MKKRKNSKRFKNSFLANKIPVIIAALLLITLLSFLIIYNNYKEVFVIDIDGYMIGSSNLDTIKQEKEPEEVENITTVEVKREESIMKNSFDHYIANENRNTVNVNYPLYVNDGLTIINYNDNINLLSTDFERTTGFSNLVLSYGKIYDNVSYTQLDQESYLFLSYQDGILINLYDIKIETMLNTYTIPTNSFMFFFENQINYLERGENGFVRKVISDVDLKSKVTFYYIGGNESYEYTYEEVITLTGSVYIQEEEPPKYVEPEPEPEPEPKPKPQKPNKPRPQPQPKPDKEPAPPAERYWEKPSVDNTEFTAQVYSLESKITINDPAGVIVKEPTFTLYINNKVSTRRTYYQSSDVVITGLSSETEYVIVGTYTYMDSDWETKKIVTFYMGTVHTKDRSSLGKIDISFENGQIYPRKMELKNLKIKSSLNSEAIRGVKKVGIRVEGETFILNTKLTQALLKGERVTVTSTDILKSNRTVTYEVLFFDKDNNIIDAINNTGVTKTCKNMPTLFLKIVDNDNINMKVSLDLRNDDKVELKNYRYILVNSAKDIIQSGKVEGPYVQVTNLDPDRVFTLKIYADMDLGDGKGLIEDIMLKDINLVTLPISSLGYIHLKASSTDITDTSASLKLELNHNRTDSRLTKLLQKLTLNIYEKNTNKLVLTKDITGDDLDTLKNRKSKTFEITDLNSFTEYRVEFSSMVKQGNTDYNLQCIYTIEPIYTRKQPVEVKVINMFANQEMIDFDIKIDDKNHAILTDDIVVELRDKKNNLIKTQLVKTNEDFVRITYNNLVANQVYKINFYANEYNETHKPVDYKTKYTLKTLTITTEPGISGTIEPISSERVSKGENLIDVKSEVKWYQTEQWYNIPKTVDKNGNLHLYSKSGTADYAYDLSEYHGKRVTVTFQIKTLTPELTNRRVYVTNYLGGTTTWNYNEEITGITTNPKSFTYSFIVGSYKNDKTDNRKVVCHTANHNGKNRCDFLTFYITGGDSFLAEYEISLLKAVVSEDEEEFKPEINYENGYYDSSGNRKVSNLDVRVSEYIELEAGTYYQFNYNTESAYIYIYNAETNARIVSIENVVSGQTYRPSVKAKMLIFFRNPSSPDELKPEKVEFTIRKFRASTKPIIYDEYQYDLITKVKVNLADIRGEISNDKYYIRIYENGKEVTCENDSSITGITNSDKAPCNVYNGTKGIKDVVHQIDLKEGKQYVVELSVYINGRFYALSNFEISTENEVMGISTVSDWVFIQPHGHYILLNDLSLEKYSGERLGYGYRYFYGEIDFQGHTLSTYSSATTSSDTNGLAIIGRVEKTGVIKNLVLDVHQDQIYRSTGSTGFIVSNYGTIENVYINFIDETEENLPNQYISPLVTTNYVGGTIKNFVVNVVNETNFYSHSSLLVRQNYGDIKNGYIYGSDIIIDPVYTSTASNLGLVEQYGGVRSRVENVYVLPNMVYPKDSKLVGGLIAYETYGQIKGVYTVGDSNGSLFSKGPAVGEVRATADLQDIYYYNSKIYTQADQQKTTATALNDVAFQQSVLGDGFNVEEMVKIGYYPHVNFTTTKMPTQPYIALPEKLDKKEVDIVSMKVLEDKKTMTTAEVEFSISNPEGAKITDISISDLDCNIVFQEYEDGNTILRAKLLNPVNYYSKYTILSITSTSSGYESTREYANGEKYANVEFFKEIRTIADWKTINDHNNQNYALMNDLSFYNNTSFYIANYSGTLEGNGFTIRDAKITTSGKRGIFDKFNGIMRNLTFENIEKTTDTPYSGVIGESTAYAVFNNVHVKDITITIPETSKQSTLYVGGFVGYSAASKYQNCSASNIKIISDSQTSGVAIGGLIGKTAGGNVINNFARNVDIKVDKSVGVEGVGGLIGHAYDGTGGDTIIANTYSTGKIVSNNIYTGGLVGVCTGTVETSYTTVNVSGDLGYVGGLVGFSTTAASGYTKNLSLGNIYTPKNGDKLIPNIELGDTNFTLEDTLINGVESSEAYGGATLTREQLSVDTTYIDVIELGKAFDYSKSSEGILPKLYQQDTEELIPNQIDVRVPTEPLNITKVEVDYGRNEAGEEKSAAIVTLTFEKIPEGSEVTNLVIEGAKMISTQQNGTDTVVAKFEPIKYYDYYKLSGVELTTNNQKEIQDKQNIIEIQFFKSIKSLEDWNAIDSNYPENYYLETDIDLSQATNQTNITLNRLIGKDKIVDGEKTKYQIHNFNLENKSNKTGICILEKVVNGISNINFNNITITDTSTGGNSYINIIRYNYGDMSDMVFKDIKIDAKKKYYVAPIGVNYAQKVSNIDIKNIDIFAYENASGFIAYAENGEGREYTNIHGDDIIVTGTTHRLAGLFGVMRTSNSVADYKINNISVINSKITASSTSATYIGGIAGYGDCGRYCTVKNTTIEGERYVGGIFGYQLSRYSRDLEVYNVTIKSDHNNGYRVGGIGGYTRDLFNSYVIDSDLYMTAPNAYGLGGISGYRDSYYFRANGVTGTTLTGTQDVGGLIGRQSGGETHSSYVQDCTIKGTINVGGLIGNHKSNWLLRSHVTRTSVEATESYAGGLIGRLGNTEMSHGYVRESYGTDMTVYSKQYAGGLFGGLFYSLYYPNTIYSLYFEGSITSEDGTTAGLATGDEFNSEVLPLDRIAFYEDSTINRVKAKTYGSKPVLGTNMLSNISLVNGHYLGNVGEEIYNRSYPNAGYGKDYIKLEAGKTYTIGVDVKSGYDWLRVKVYDVDGTFIKDMTSASNNHYPRAYNFNRQNQVTFHILRDVYIRVMFYDMTQIDGYYLYETTYGNHDVNADDLLDYQDLITKSTWTRYQNSTGTSYDYAYSTKLNFPYNNYDFTKINNRIDATVTTSKGLATGNAVASITSLPHEGMIMDGKNDTVTIENASLLPPKDNFTVSARITPISNTMKTYQFIYLANDPSKNSNGFGLFVHSSSSARLLYIRINGSNYSTGLYIPLKASTEVTATYQKNTNNTKYTTKVYINGVLRYTKSDCAAITMHDTAKIRISPSNYDTGGTNARYLGIYEYLAVYDTVISESLIKNNYNTTNWNVNNLQYLFDFRNINSGSFYKEGAHYPTLLETNVKGEDGNYIIQKYQEKLPAEYDANEVSRLTPLPNPSLTNRTYMSNRFSVSNQTSSTISKDMLGSNIIMLNKAIKDIYKVYPSGTNTVNIEFDKTYADVSFKYKNGDYQSPIQKLTDRTFTLSYDYKNDLILTIKGSSQEETITITKEDLAKTIQINNNEYYHIENNKLYNGDKKIVDNAYNIYNNLVLLDNNKVYDIETKETYEVITHKGIYASPIPLAEYNVQNRVVKTFYNYSIITDLEGNEVVRNVQIHVRGEKIYIFDANDSSKQDMNVFNTYNTEEYQVSLIDGHLISIKAGIKIPNYFSNNNIEEVDQDVNSKDAIIMVRYKNGYTVAFDYYTGEELFSYGTKEKVSLFKFIGNSMSGEYVLSSSNNTFSESNKLKETVTNVTDKEVKDKLSDKLTSPSKPNNNEYEGEPVDNTGTVIESTKLTDEYVQIYNNTTGEYEVYSTNDILNSNNTIVESTSNKINRNAFLYNYFQGQERNTFFEKTRLTIIMIIIGLVIINLALFIKNINTKEAHKNEKIKAN